MFQAWKIIRDLVNIHQIQKCTIQKKENAQYHHASGERNVSIKTNEKFFSNAFPPKNSNIGQYRNKFRSVIFSVCR